MHKYCTKRKNCDRGHAEKFMSKKPKVRVLTTREW